MLVVAATPTEAAAAAATRAANETAVRCGSAKKSGLSFAGLCWFVVCCCCCCNPVDVEHRNNEENVVENEADEDEDNQREEAGTDVADTAVLLPNTIVRNDEDNRTSILHTCLR